MQQILGTPAIRTFFGVTKAGLSVEKILLRNEKFEAEILTYGGVIAALRAPDKTGKLVDVVLGYDTLVGYEENEGYLGALLGRYANRIGGAQLFIDGQTHKLIANEGTTQLHGGPESFSFQVFEVAEATTLLGKSKKASVKSKKKVAVPQDQWAVTENTHPPLVSQRIFALAQLNLGKGSRDYRAYDHVRRSIFGGVAVCSKCGYALCSGGTIYKGEREKYWYLSCSHQRLDIPNPCEGVRVRYADLLEVVRQDLNSLLALNDEEIDILVKEALRRAGSQRDPNLAKVQRKSAEARIAVIDRMISKLYSDNASGFLDDDRLRRMVAELERESAGLQATLNSLDTTEQERETEDNYAKFFALAKDATHIKELDRDTLLTFVERIEVGPKEYPGGTVKATHRNQPFRQKIRIFYRFIGEMAEEPTRDFPVGVPIHLKTDFSVDGKQIKDGEIIHFPQQ